MLRKSHLAPSVASDRFYEKVPREQIDQLKNFRLTHRYKQLPVGSLTWDYISCGQGEQALLLLPGALSTGESTFSLIMSLENQYRIIAPSYALSLTMTGLCDGISRILEAERIRRIHVLGGSYGGFVAQCFVRKYPDRTQSLVLSHTAVFQPKYIKSLQIVAKLIPFFPQRLFVSALRFRLNKILLSTLRSARHPEAEFWRAYLDEAIATNLLKDVFIHQNKCLLDCAQNFQFTAEDLIGWPGRILIVESDDDPAISERDREELNRIYPQAQVHTFHKTGHASSIIKREEYVSVIKAFLRSVDNQGVSIVGKAKQRSE